MTSTDSTRIAGARQAATGFSIDGRLVACSPWGPGHIHDSFKSRFETPDGDRFFLHQRLNRDVFRQPKVLMETVQRVSAHQQNRQAERHPGDWRRRTLQLVPSVEGPPFHIDPAGDWWRTFVFIDDTTVLSRLTRQPRQAFSLGACFGEFLADLEPLAIETFPETIPGFHNLHSRLEQLEREVSLDRFARLSSAGACVEELMDLRHIEDRLTQERRQTPVRLTHNDAKLENLLFDSRSGEGLCVTDIDTVMPGLALFDFGDLIRTTALDRREDDVGGSRSADVDWQGVEQVVEGFVSGCPSLSNPELAGLSLGPLVMSYETAIRFLTDYLEGDVYFRTGDPEHNLRRARAQIETLKVLMKIEGEIEGLIQSVRRDPGLAG